LRFRLCNLTSGPLDMVSGLEWFTNKLLGARDRESF
jgi:hypothetical protein